MEGVRRRLHSAATVLLPAALALLAAGCGGDGPRTRWDSFERQLLQAPRPERQALVDSFFVELEAEDQLRSPLVEDSQAVFLFRARARTPVTVAGDQNLWDPAADTLRRIAGTDLYARAQVFPREARLDYKYVLGGGDWILDPLNPRTMMSGFGPNSELAMPDYSPPREIHPREAVPAGRVQSFPFTSEVLGNTRYVHVYLPARYDTTRSYPLLLVHDGSDYLNLGRMQEVLDNTIAAGSCRPLVAVFVDPVDRMIEYWMNQDFNRMVLEEILPYVQSRYAVSGDPARRGVMGASLGGLTALLLAHRHPDQFGLAAGQSSAVWVDEEALLSEVAEGPPSGMKVWMDVGTFEAGGHGEADYVDVNFRLARVLERQGSRVRFVQVPQGHSWGSWRARIDDILAWLYPPLESAGAE